MAIDIRSRANRKKPEGQTYAPTDPGRSRGARIATAALIALAAIWQAFVLRQAQSSEAAEETAGQGEDLQPANGAPLSVRAVFPHSVTPSDDGEQAGSTQPISAGIQGTTITPTVPDAQPRAEAGGGGGGTVQGSGENQTLADLGPEGPLSSTPETQVVANPTPGGQTPVKPTLGDPPKKPAPDAEIPAKPEPEGSGAVPTPPVVEGPTTDSLLPYGLDDLLADLAQIVAPQTAVVQAAFLSVAVDDWLSAAQQDSLRRAPETVEGAMDWESYARDRQQISALENPTAREAYLLRFMPGGLDGEGVGSGSDLTAPSEPDAFSNEVSGG